MLSKDDLARNEADKWTGYARQGLKHYHAILVLGQMAWGDAFAQKDLRTTDISDIEQQGYVLQAALRWGLEQLQVGDSYMRKSYDTLWLRYVKQMTIAECASALERDETTVKQRQRRGWERLGEVLRKEAEAPVAQEARRLLMWQLRYEACEREDQTLLRFLSIFRQGVSFGIGLVMGEMKLQPHLARLIERGLVVQNGAVEIIVPLEVKVVALRHLVSAENPHFHTLAATFYQQQDDTIETLYHWQQANQQERAITLLLDKQTRLNNVDLQVCLNGFKREAVSADSWAQIKLISGHLAQASDNLDIARAEYTAAALGADDALLRAEGYYRIGRICRQLDVNQSLANFALCQKIVAKRNDKRAIKLYIQSLLQETWVFIDQQPNLITAKSRLDRISQLLTDYLADDRLTLQADLENGWASYYRAQNQFSHSVEHRWQAWIYARQARDIERARRFSFNLASDYFDLQQYDDAERMFLECQALAQAEQNKWVVAACHKGVGACYLLRDANYLRAITHYEKAYAYFQSVDNRHWMSTACYDLAEAHLLCGQLTIAQHYFDEGINLAADANIEDVREEFLRLQNKYLELSNTLTSQQCQLINFIRTHTRINKQNCAKLLKISARTANRRLSELVALGLISQQGEGRGVHYILTS